MSSGNSPTLTLELPARRSLASVGLLAALVVLVAVLMLSGVLRGGVRGALLMVVLGIAASALVLWQQGYWQGSRRVQRLVWLQAGPWQVTLADGQVFETVLTAQSWITGWLWCLRFEAAAAPAMLVWRGQMSAHAWRQWRVRLTLEGRLRPSAADAF